MCFLLTSEACPKPYGHCISLPYSVDGLEEVKHSPQAGRRILLLEILGVLRPWSNGLIFTGVTLPSPEILALSIGAFRHPKELTFLVNAFELVRNGRFTEIQCIPGDVRVAEPVHSLIHTVHFQLNGSPTFYTYLFAIVQDNLDELSVWFSNGRT
jgi:hypothetical protein